MVSYSGHRNHKGYTVVSALYRFVGFSIYLGDYARGESNLVMYHSIPQLGHVLSVG